TRRSRSASPTSWTAPSGSTCWAPTWLPCRPTPSAASPAERPGPRSTAPGSAELHRPSVADARVSSRRRLTTPGRPRPGGPKPLRSNLAKRVATLAAALLTATALLVGNAPTAGSDPVWAPANQATIHPGVQMITGGGQCTANFVFTQGDDVFLGYAAHCAGT